jgi:hypothetical protein
MPASRDHGEGRDPDSPHERETRQYTDREVEGANVADEVLVVRSIGRDPRVPEPRKTLVEAARKHKRPDSDEQTDRTKERQRESACPLHQPYLRTNFIKQRILVQPFRLSASGNCFSANDRKLEHGLNADTTELDRRAADQLCPLRDEI